MENTLENKNFSVVLWIRIRIQILLKLYCGSTTLNILGAASAGGRCRLETGAGRGGGQAGPQERPRHVH